ncbi:alpha/beta fold hydrolase [Rathayibacter sp. SD072]|uniref:alpha/beta fold hydrolase n=1 Tax=Rathayibacter sp. SD072 TaxID=2781731 RepID=UPI001A965BFA|nr:alpha/beta hydrolase [Rathayibacter sp. SD072]MBO0984580.1 alpha/beta hydrolase [Rathayibacter sp. SD072]
MNSVPAEWVRAGGAALRVHRFPGRKGRRFVLVHGWGCSSASWEESIEGLLDLGDVVALDLRGHGGSEAGSVRASIPRLARDVLEVVGTLGPGRVTLIGHSMGGAVVTAAAVSEPRSVDSLVVIDPAYGADNEEMGSAPARLHEYRAAGPGKAAADVGRAFSSDAPEALIGRARKDLLRASPRVLADAFESLYLAPESFGAADAAVEYLRSRRRPTLALYPTRDRAATEHRAADGSGPVSIRIAPVQSHFLHEEAPTWFVSTVRDWTAGADLPPPTR